jgi:hypothetical protein
MAINLIDIIKQKNGAVFPLYEDIDGLGGFKTVADTTARNAIDAVYRKEGMFVWTIADAKLWRLNAGLSTWTEFTGGGGAATAITDATLTAAENIFAQDPVALNASGGLIRANAEVSTNQEVYGICTTSASAGNLVPVILSGIWTYTSAFAVPSVVYLGVGGGATGTPPNPSVAGRRITRLGQVRTTTTMFVQIQVIGST